MHQGDSAGVPSHSYLPMQSHRSEFSWYTYEVSFSQNTLSQFWGPQSRLWTVSGAPRCELGPKSRANGAPKETTRSLCADEALLPDAPVSINPGYVYAEGEVCTTVCIYEVTLPYLNCDGVPAISSPSIR